MLTLFQNYSVSDIIIFVILLGLAIKELWTFVIWAKDRNREGFNKKKEKDKSDEVIKRHTESIEKLNEKLSNIDNQINLLLLSDKEDIKAYVIEQHQRAMNRKKIDFKTLDCLEKRFKYYQQEGGNSFVEELVDEIRRLPKEDNF